MTWRTATVWIALFAVLTVAGLRLGGARAHSAGATHRGGAKASPGESITAHVDRAVDGDTIDVTVQGRHDTVRYIGVDTPESVKPGVPVQCYAETASHFNRRLVQGRDVTLTVGREPRDKYGRLLAYVAVANRSVEVALLRGGYARTLEFPPNVDRAPTYRRLEDAAASAGKGLWGACRLPLAR